jgi:hypothetical protein
MSSGVDDNIVTGHVRVRYINEVGHYMLNHPQYF